VLYDLQHPTDNISVKEAELKIQEEYIVLT